MLEIMKGFDNSTESKRNPTVRHLQTAIEYLTKTGGRDGQIEKFATFQVGAGVLRAVYTMSMLL